MGPFGFAERFGLEVEGQLVESNIGTAVPKVGSNIALLGRREPHSHRFWLNDSAAANMPHMDVTLETSHDDMS